MSAPHGTPTRAMLIAERLALIERLQAMPAELRERPQWLLWRFVEKPGAKKPAKMPYYVNGHPRGWPRGRPADGKPTQQQPQVDQGHDLDRACLVPLDRLLQRLQGSLHWEGAGFAFLPGDGLIGIDIDGGVDRESGELSDLCRTVVESCGSYTETSPSGAGVHVIVTGETETFKSDDVGLEVYCGRQYFTCTGRALAGTVADVRPVPAEALAWMRQVVEKAKDEARARREAERQAAAAETAAQLPEPAGDEPPPPPREAPPAKREAPATDSRGADDFRRVNDQALANVHAWVPRLFAEAKPYKDGYRVTSKALGRSLQEDLQITPEGVMDFGEERGMSPIDLVMQWQPGASTPKDALHWLAEAIGVALTPRRAGRSPARNPLPPGKGAAPAARGQGEGAPEDAPADAGDGPPGDDPPAGDAEAAAGPKKHSKAVWQTVHMMCERFVLIYGTDMAWDRLKLKQVRIPALRLAFGKTPVNLWLTREERQMADPEHLVFEPGDDVQPPLINMWGGLDLEPQACEPEDVEVMIELLRHLCSETVVTDADGQRVESSIDDAMHWIMCWQALPLKAPGTKMATALVMHGAQGTGKNLYFDAWRDMFGSYGITVTQTELEDKYNGWTSRKLAAVGDEVVSRQEMYHNKNRLKLIVTQREKFAIRDLYAAVRWESNHMNVVFLSNESEPLVLEDRDRRYLVIYTPLEAPAELYQRVRDFLAAGGLAKWMYYLMHFETGDFNAHTKPPMTEAKRALIEANWRPAVRFVHEWLEGFLDLNVQVCSAEQLYRAFRRWCDQSGERWPPSQDKFTREVNRWVSESRRRGPDGNFPPPRLAYKPINLTEPGSKRKTVRCFIPKGCGPREGVSEGSWAWEAVQNFENELWKFLGRKSLGDEEGGS